MVCLLSSGACHDCREARLRAGRRIRRLTLTMPSWHFRWCRIPAFCVLWCLGSTLLSLQASVFGERDLPRLSSDGLSALVTGVSDPIHKLDPANPTSHLSKILIPRVRKSLCYLFILQQVELRIQLIPKTAP